MIIETDRLYMRRLTEGDFDALCKILQDEKCMYAYEHAFSDEEVREWLCKQLVRYRIYGFGLWAVILKESGELIGQCGITIQHTDRESVMEVGYLFRRDCWNKGYCTEALKSAKTLPLINLAQTRCIPLFVTATQLQGVLPRKTA